MAKTPGSQCRGPRFDLWSRTKSHMLQLKALHAATKTRCSQISVLFFFLKKSYSRNGMREGSREVGQGQARAGFIHMPILWTSVVFPALQRHLLFLYITPVCLWSSVPSISQSAEANGTHSPHQLQGLVCNTDHQHLGHSDGSRGRHMTQMSPGKAGSGIINR